jgi:hypothetical protein
LQLGDYYEGEEDVSEIAGSTLQVSVHGINGYGEEDPNSPNKCVYGDDLIKNSE